MPPHESDYKSNSSESDENGSNVESSDSESVDSESEQISNKVRPVSLGTNNINNKAILKEGPQPGLALAAAKSTKSSISQQSDSKNIQQQLQQDVGTSNVGDAPPPTLSLESVGPEGQTLTVSQGNLIVNQNVTNINNNNNNNVQNPNLKQQTQQQTVKTSQQQKQQQSRQQPQAQSAREPGLAGPPTQSNSNSTSEEKNPNLNLNPAQLGPVIKVNNIKNFLAHLSDYDYQHEPYHGQGGKMMNSETQRKKQQFWDKEGRRGVGGGGGGGGGDDGGGGIGQGLVPDGGKNKNLNLKGKGKTQQYQIQGTGPGQQQGFTVQTSQQSPLRPNISGSPPQPHAQPMNLSGPTNNYNTNTNHYNDYYDYDIDDSSSESQYGSPERSLRLTVKAARESRYARIESLWRIETMGKLPIDIAPIVKRYTREFELKNNLKLDSITLGGGQTVQQYHYDPSMGMQHQQQGPGQQHHHHGPQQHWQQFKPIPLGPLNTSVRVLRPTKSLPQRDPNFEFGSSFEQEYGPRSTLSDLEFDFLWAYLSDVEDDLVASLDILDEINEQAEEIGDLDDSQQTGKQQQNQQGLGSGSESEEKGKSGNNQESGGNQDGGGSEKEKDRKSNHSESPNTSNKKASDQQNQNQNNNIKSQISNVTEKGVTQGSQRQPSKQATPQKPKVREYVPTASTYGKGYREVMDQESPSVPKSVRLEVIKRVQQMRSSAERKIVRELGRRRPLEGKIIRMYGHKGPGGPPFGFAGGHGFGPGYQQQYDPYNSYQYSQQDHHGQLSSYSLVSRNESTAYFNEIMDDEVLKELAKFSKPPTRKVIQDSQYDQQQQLQDRLNLNLNNMNQTDQALLQIERSGGGNSRENLGLIQEDEENMNYHGSTVTLKDNFMPENPTAQGFKPVRSANAFANQISSGLGGQISSVVSSGLFSILSKHGPYQSNSYSQSLSWNSKNSANSQSQQSSLSSKESSYSTNQNDDHGETQQQITSKRLSQKSGRKRSQQFAEGLADGPFHIISNPQPEDHDLELDLNLAEQDENNLDGNTTVNATLGSSPINRSSQKGHGGGKRTSKMTRKMIRKAR